MLFLCKNKIPHTKLFLLQAQSNPPSVKYSRLIELLETEKQKTTQRLEKMKQKRSSPTRNNADNHSGKRDLYKIALLLREANKISQLLKKNMASITLLKIYSSMLKKNVIPLFHLFSLLSIFVDWQKLRCSLMFEFVILTLVKNFSGFLCLSLCTISFCLIEPTKSLKIYIQRISGNSKYQIQPGPYNEEKKGKWL